MRKELYRFAKMDTLQKIFSLVFIFCNSFLFGQNSSKIYKKNGTLIADSTFSISRIQRKDFLHIEDTLLKQICNKIIYPEVEREAQIGDSLIVVSFTINKNDSLKDFKIEKRLEKSDIGIIKEIERLLVKHSPALGYHVSNKINGRRFYLAFKFSMNGTFTGAIIRNGVIIMNYKKLEVYPEGHSVRSVIIDY